MKPFSSRLDRVTGRIAASEIALGWVVTTRDSTVTEMLASCGFDFI